MSVDTFTRVIPILGYLWIVFSASLAQEAGPVTFPSTLENRTVRNDQQVPSVLGNKKIDWWPPAVQTLDQEVTQNPAYAYSAWMQQPPLPASYYLSAPPISGQVRSEHHTYPPEYLEYAHPVVHQGAGTSLGLGPKHLAIVSFIGLLLLFAVIQSSLMSAKRKDALVEALSTRKRRDLYYFTDEFGPVTSEQKEILNDDAKLRCIQRTVCMENRKLIQNLGSDGTKLAKYLTSSIRKSVRKSSGWDRLIEDAGAAGLRGEDCNVLYRDCVLPVISRSRRNHEK